jgi:hypothetical protein
MIIIKRSGNSYSANSFRMNFLVWKLFDKLLFLIKPIAEYALGMHIGFALGWLIGLCAGHFYVNHFEPLYLDDLNKLAFWTAVPHTFAKYGALTGPIIGILAILKINSNLLNEEIIKLYEKGVTNPTQIARLLDSNLNKIQRKMSKLAEKGKISQNATYENTSV